MQNGIRVSLSMQRLTLAIDGRVVGQWACSTAAAGPGEQNGQGGTPRGAHRIRMVIGRNAPAGAVFVGRRPTGEIYTPSLGAQAPARDWILSRVLWLTGIELGFNRGGAVDTLRRLIYIHGTPDTEPMGVPRSHGCIRMRNEAVIELADQCWPGMAVVIDDDTDKERFPCSGH
ncbi:L,D-transpeptidase family protein [Spiribacter pallidus]|uniref:L,D-transpeptidase n=1 Tax=Spiribacter pallidus TaxID=1987936 RepID=A0ABV3TEV4_9GAMM